MWIAVNICLSKASGWYSLNDHVIFVAGVTKVGVHASLNVLHVLLDIGAEERGGGVDEVDETGKLIAAKCRSSEIAKLLEVPQIDSHWLVDGFGRPFACEFEGIQRKHDQREQEDGFRVGLGKHFILILFIQQKFKTSHTKFFFSLSYFDKW